MHKGNICFKAIKNKFQSIALNIIKMQRVLKLNYLILNAVFINSISAKFLLLPRAYVHSQICKNWSVATI